MSKSMNLGNRTLKSVLSIHSNIRQGALDEESLTMSNNFTMLGPSFRFCSILISLFIFFFLTFVGFD